MRDRSSIIDGSQDNDVLKATGNMLAGVVGLRCGGCGVWWVAGVGCGGWGAWVMDSQGPVVVGFMVCGIGQQQGMMGGGVAGQGGARGSVPAGAMCRCDGCRHIAYTPTYAII